MAREELSLEREGSKEMVRLEWHQVKEVLGCED
jgi:hypothetical protein